MGEEKLGSKKTPEAGEQVKLLIEIVSCWNLLKGDMRSSDPYVKVKLAGKDIHETKHMKQTLNPVFTIKSDSIFCLDVPAQELFDANGLFFKVKDWDAVGSNDELGSVQVPAQAIYDSTGERMEFKLTPPKGKEKKDAGFIAIKCRPATDNDTTFLECVKKKDTGLLGVRSALTPRKPSGGTGRPGLFGSNSKVEKTGPNKGKKIYRIRPEADPERAADTEWMTEEEIETESQKQSRNWLDVGTGDLGKIFFEVIGANGLENKDGGLGKNKTDAFCAIVYEDCMAKTDVIDDCLNPRWMPWMQRGFIFRMMHTSSQILVGLFDHDTGIGNDHDLVGRISVDLTNLAPRTDYMLQYNLYKTAKIAKREPQGTITIRLRIEFEAERKAVLASLKPPPVVYVNVKAKDDFRVVRKTIDGKYDTKRYSTETINSYVDELKTYKQLMFYLQDAALNLIFWRGHFPLPLRVPGAAPKSEKSGSKKPNFLDSFSRPVKIHLPLHSMNAFIAAISLAERPSLAPSLFFFGIAWLLLAVMGYKRNSPNPWGRCKSFGEFARVLLFGGFPSASITAHENEEEYVVFKADWDKRIKDAEEAAAKAKEDMLKEQEEYEKLMEEVGETTADTDISTSTGTGPSLALLKPILYPIQQYLAMACEGIRILRNIIIWEESYLSFWIAAGSLFLGILFLFVPWAFFIRWTSRIVAWTFFGPWMMLLDIFWYSKRKVLSEEEKKLQDEAELKAKIEAAERKAAEARAKREEAAKLKDMKAVLYGDYITKVPILKIDRYRDEPLYTSTATPCRPDLSKNKSRALSVRVGGQQLVGDMIPKVKAD